MTVKKAMISQAMNGKSDSEILEVKEIAVRRLTEKGFEIVNSFFTDEWFKDIAMDDRGIVNKPLVFMAKSIEKMAQCHAVYFCKDWQLARGCRIEHEIATAYALEIIYE